MIEQTHLLRRFSSWIFITLSLILIMNQLFQYSMPRFPWPKVTSHVADSNQSYDTTIVTGYFPFAKAKHSKTEYLSWLKNLLGFCQSPMIIFTSAEYYPILYELRQNGSLKTVFIVDYQSPRQMPPILPLLSTFEQQHSTDRERAYHSVDLYAIWCAKSYMLNRSAELNPFGSQYFLYVDAGAFRSTPYRFQKWPDSSIMRKVLKKDRFLLSMIDRLPARFCPLQYKIADGPISLDLIEGGIMGGSARAIHWWISVFYNTLNIYRSRNFFIGKDQTSMNAIAISHAQNITMILAFRVPCKDVWFAFAPLLAHQDEKFALSYSTACREQNLTEIIIPFDRVCDDKKNIKNS